MGVERRCAVGRGRGLRETAIPGSGILTVTLLAAVLPARMSTAVIFPLLLSFWIIRRFSQKVFTKAVLFFTLLATMNPLL